MLGVGKEINEKEEKSTFRDIISSILHSCRAYNRGVDVFDGEKSEYYRSRIVAYRTF